MIWFRLALAVATMGAALMLGGAALGWLIARYRLYTVAEQGAAPESAARTGWVFATLFVLWTLLWLVLSVLMALGGGHPPSIVLLPASVSLWLLGIAAFWCYRFVLRRAVRRGLAQ